MPDFSKIPDFADLDDITPSQSKEDKLTLVIQELNQMVGLGTVKRKLRDLIALARVVAVRRSRKMPVENINLHMVFYGPPGTGKSVVARKVGTMLHAIGMLEHGRCVQVDNATLIAGYEGQTPRLVDDNVKKALGGVLFIDEAYSLLGGHSYGKQAIETLLIRMEEHRHQLVVIVAGYFDEMEQLLDSNPGLRSRFSNLVSFESYNESDLIKIFKAMAKQYHYVFTPEAEDEVATYLRHLKQTANEKTFGNARAVRVFLESIIPVQARRISKIPNLEQEPDSLIETVEKIDVLQAIG